VTSLGAVPPAIRSDLREELRRRAGEWLARFYRHEILVARTVRGMQVEAVEEFNRAVVTPLLKAVGGTLSTFQPRGNDLVPQLFPEIASLRTEIDAVVARGSDAVRRLTERRMQEIADQEVTWTTQSAKAATGDGRFGDVVEPKAQVAEAVKQRPWLGDSTEKWFGKMLAVPTADAVKAWVNTGITQGLTTDEIVRGLRGTKDQTGILADKPTYAVAALVRTAATHASSVARVESFRALGVGHWRFVATLDSKTSVQCAAQDGKVYELGKGPMPPLHPNAVFAGSTFVSYGRLEEMVRASYRGPAIHVRAGNYRTTIGPNHPMLTKRGMVKAADLREGDQLLYDLRHDGAVFGGCESHLEKVHLVEDVFGAITASGVLPSVARSSHDLHGDRVFCEGEVEVVEPKRLLLPELDPCGIQKLRHPDLVLPDAGAEAGPSHRAGDLGFSGIDLPTSGGMGGADARVLANAAFEWVAITHVSHGQFVGKAFDATTESSLYCSDGFVVSNCRSSAVPVFDPSEAPYGDRATVDGPTSADKTFPEWLQQQSKARQNEVLGATKAEAWRSGRLPIEKMLGADLQPLTLQELRDMDRI
jgi:hypothetical protein